MATGIWEISQISLKKLVRSFRNRPYLENGSCKTCKMPLAPRWVSLALCLQTISVAVAGLGGAPKLSVLFFLVDDGGFEIGTFGNNVTSTPNIDGLAARAGCWLPQWNVQH